MSAKANLEKELEVVGIPKAKLAAMEELLYTASETSLLSIRLDEEDTLILLKLAVLAEKYEKGVPTKLRM